MSKNKKLVYGTAAYQEQAREMAKLGGWIVGSIDRQIFPDGEHYMRIADEVADRDVVVVGGTCSDSDTLEIYDLCCALVKYGARKLELVIPYFGYSTMERAVKKGEIVTAKTRARLLSSIPTADQGNRIYFLDLHSEGIPHYLEGAMTSVHVYGKPFVFEAIEKMKLKDLVLASTDAGRAKWVQSLADDLGVQASFVFKRRIDGEKTEISAVSAHVEDKDVVIYDDMIRTGGSLVNAAKAYLNAGARTINVISTHGIFPEGSIERLKNEKIFQSVHVTDSHPNAKADDLVKVYPVAPLFVKELQSHEID